jgi:hypothetical protein
VGSPWLHFESPLALLSALDLHCLFELCSQVGQFDLLSNLEGTFDGIGLNANRLDAPMR